MKFLLIIPSIFYALSILSCICSRKLSDFENVHTLVESMEEKLFNSVWYRVTGHFAYAYASENC